MSAAQAQSQPPAAPTLSATAEWRQARLNWTHGNESTVDDYLIYRSASSGGAYSLIAQNILPPTKTYLNTGLTDNTTYYYRVTARNTYGESSPSNIVSVTLGADTVAPLGSIISPVNGTRLSTHSIGTISGTVADELGGSDVNLVNLRLYRLPGWPGQNYEYWNGSQWTGPTVATLATTLTRNNSITTSQAYDWVSNATLPAGADLPSGWYAIAIVVYDKKGNGRTISTSFMVGTDVTPPQLVITIPAVPSGAGALDPIELTSLAEIAGTCVDPPGSPGDEVTGMYRVQVSLTRVVGGVTEYWNGTAWSGTAASLLQILAPNATAWSMTSNLPSGANLPSGDYKIVAKGVDRTLLNGAGNTRNIRIVTPGSPTDLVALGRDASVKLTWTAGAHASSYTIKRSLTSGGTFTPIATGVTSTEYINTGLPNGTTYYYKVSAVAPTGESPDSNEASATPVLDTTAPNLAIVAPAANTRFSTSNIGSISGTVTDELAGSGIQKVMLRISRVVSNVTTFWNGSAWQTGTTFLTTTLTPDPSVTNAQSYQWTSNTTLPTGNNLPPMSYLIQATGYDNRNNIIQPTSRFFVGSDVTLPVITLTTPASNVDPAVPVEMVALTQMSGACADPPGAPGADVTGVNYIQAYISKLDGGVRKYWYASNRTWETNGFFLNAVLSQNATAWSVTSGFPTVSEMLPGDYLLEVRAVDHSNNISTRPFVKVRIVAPPAPSNLTAIGGDGAVQLTWTAVPHALGYKVKRSTSSGAGYSDLTPNAATNSYLDTTVANNSTYYYKVSAFTGGDGPDSAEVMAKTQATGIDAQIGEADGTSYVGDTIYNGTGSSQSKSKQSIPAFASVYRAKVTNKTGATTTVKASGPLSGSGWTIKYFVPGTSSVPEVEITDAEPNDSEWTTSFSLANNAIKEILIKVTPDATVSSAAPDNLKDVLIRFASSAAPEKFDVVKASTTRIRLLDHIEYTIDQGGNWWSIGQSGAPAISIVQGATIGLRTAKPSGVTMDWPSVPGPIKPVWTDVIDNNYKYIGHTIYIQYNSPTGFDSQGATIPNIVKAECGDIAEIAVKVRPNYSVDIYSAANSITAGGVGSGAQTIVTAEVRAWNGVPVEGAKVTFTSTYQGSGAVAGTISDSAAGADSALTDSSGKAQVTLTSGSIGIALVQATVIDPAGQPVNISDICHVNFR
jgi:fibronectin type 3 domain-containing protein